MKPTACVTVSLGVIALAGCGGSDPLTKKEYTSQANVICKEESKRVDALDSPSDIKSLATYAEKTKQISEDLKRRLSELAPPDEDKAAVDDMLGNLGEAADNLEKVKQAAEDGDAKKAEELAEKISNSPFDKQAEKLGLNECGESS